MRKYVAISGLVGALLGCANPAESPRPPKQAEACTDPTEICGYGFLRHLLPDDSLIDFKNRFAERIPSHPEARPTFMRNPRQPFDAYELSCSLPKSQELESLIDTLAIRDGAWSDDIFPTKMIVSYVDRDGGHAPDELYFLFTRPDASQRGVHAVMLSFGGRLAKPQWVGAVSKATYPQAESVLIHELVSYGEYVMEGENPLPDSPANHPTDTDIPRNADALEWLDIAYRACFSDE